MGLINRCHLVTDEEMTSLANCIRAKLSESSPYLWRTEMVSALKRLPGNDSETEAQKAIGGYWSEWIDSSYSRSIVVMKSYIRDANPISLISLSGSSYCVPSHLGSYMLYLTSLFLSGCSTVGQGAFYGCQSMKNVDLPDCVSIGSAAFGGCGLLSSFNAPNVQTLGQMAFLEDASLTELSLPNLSYIPEMTFAGCINLSSLYCPSCTGAANSAFNQTPFSTLVWGENFVSISGQPFVNMYFLSSFEAVNLSNTGGNTLTFTSCPSLTTVSVPSLDNTLLKWDSIYTTVNIGAYSAWAPAINSATQYALENLTVALQGYSGAAKTYQLKSLGYFSNLTTLTVKDRGANTLSIGPLTTMGAMANLSDINIQANKFQFTALTATASQPMICNMSEPGNMVLRATSGNFLISGFYSSITMSSMWFFESALFDNIEIHMEQATVARLGHCLAKNTYIGKLTLDIPTMVSWATTLIEVDPFENTTIGEICVPASLYNSYTANAAWDLYNTMTGAVFTSF